MRKERGGEDAKMLQLIGWWHEKVSKKRGQERDYKKDGFADMNFHFSSTCWHEKVFKKLHF